MTWCAGITDRRFSSKEFRRGGKDGYEPCFDPKGESHSTLVEIHHSQRSFAADFLALQTSVCSTPRWGWFHALSEFGNVIEEGKKVSPSAMESIR